MRATLVVLVVLVGCAADVPAGAVGMDAETLEVARAAWTAQGLTAPACDAPLLITVSAEEFTAHSPLPACVTAARGELCAYAATNLNEYTHPVTFYTPDPRGLPELEVLAHETFHVWVQCTLGQEDGDYHHVRSEIWGEHGAIGFVDDVAGAPYRGYPEIP